jgi:hypothetical protein
MGSHEKNFTIYHSSNYGIDIVIISGILTGDDTENQ